MKRFLAATVIGFIVGAGVWAAVNSVLEAGPWKSPGSDPSWDPWGFWGLFFGGFAAAATFGLALMVLARHSARVRAIGRWLAIATLLLFGLLISFGPYGAFSQPLFSLEGAWLYPLGLTPLLLAAWLIWSPRRKRRPGLWDAPAAPSTSG